MPDPIPLNGPRHHTCTREADFEAIKVDIGEIRDDAKHEREHRIRVEGKVDGLGTKMDRIINGIEIGTIRPVLPSLDYGEGERTQVQTRDELVARSKVAERDAAGLAAKAEDERVRRVTLEEQVAALEATLVERVRYSDRVRSDARFAMTTRAQVIMAALSGGGIVALIGAAVQLARWLIGG
jgi:hypothetical protein